MILKMAIRNIFRHKKRTIITISSMIFGIMLTMFANGLNKGIERQIIDIYIKTEIGQVKLYAKDYYADKENNDYLKYLIKNRDKIDGFAKSYNENLVFDGVLNTGEEDYPIIIKGVEKKSEEEYFRRSKDIVSGNFLEEKNEIVIGEKIAELLKISLEDEITILTRTGHGSINAYDKKIGGIIKTENSIMNMQTVFMNINEAKELALVDGINQIILNKYPSKETMKNLEKYYDVIPWEKDLEDIIELIKVKIRNTTYVGAFVMLIAAVGIINTMLMAMLEREKEIGVLMANGMSRLKIMALFVLEGGFIGFVGSGVGFLLGAILVLITEKYGIPLPDYTDIGMQISMPDKMYSYFDFKEFVMYFIAGVFIALISSFYAAHKASRLNPVDVLHRK